MYKYVVDAMGGDLGAKVIVEAIKNYLKDHDDAYFYLVGNEEELASLKEENKVKIISSVSVMKMDATPLEAMRLKDSSMFIAFQTFMEEKADAIISAGGTGAFLSLATIKLRLIEGLRRAALIAPFPTLIKGKKTCLLDIGANNENSPEELVDFALMGKLYVESVYDVKDPKIYLLSNGTEEHKGSPLIKETHKLLKEKAFPGFMGNIEAREALNGSADVIVMDGFTGNVFLKSSEGMAKMMSSLIKKAFKRSLASKIGYLFSRKGFKELQETMDYKTTGGAMFLGVNGVVVKAHGSSDAYSFYHAIKVADALVKKDITKQIKEKMAL